MEHDIFENLNPEQNRFLLAFLRHRGNLKGVQNELGISYIVAKDKLDNLLFQLHLTTDEVNRSKKEKAAMISLKFDRSNPKASEIIKKMCPTRTANFVRQSRTSQGHIQTVEYIAAITL